MTNDLTGKATTKTPITVTTDPNTHVDLLDKDNHVIGSVRRIVMVELQLHQRCLFLEGNVRAKATDNAEHPTVHFLNRRNDDTTPQVAQSLILI